jgi:NADH-quinone oxidoreductase subunit H
MAIGWVMLGNILGTVYFIVKVYVLICVFLWLEGTLPRLRSDQLMQFAWLILIPATLGNILLTGLIYLIVSGLGGSNLIFLIVTGAINWVLLFGFIRLIRRVTVTSTRRAQAPMLHAQARRRALLPAVAESAEVVGEGIPQ